MNEGHPLTKSDAKQLEQLFDAACTARENAYAPYSGFKVGAVAVSEGGLIFSGCNAENAAYPVGTCAEVGAIAAMIAAGERKLALMMIVGSGSGPCFPCGACRQRIAEFSTPATLIYVGSESGLLQKSFTISELLPHGFDFVPQTSFQSERK